MSAVLPPPEWKGRDVPVLEMLLFIREQLAQGVMPELFLGRLDIESLAAFIKGYAFALYCRGVLDPGYQAFITWLRDVKSEFPAGGGWARRCLDVSGGEHRAAIQRFLDLVSEFVVTSREGKPVPD